MQNGKLYYWGSMATSVLSFAIGLWALSFSVGGTMQQIMIPMVWVFIVLALIMIGWTFYLGFKEMKVSNKSLSQTKSTQETNIANKPSINVGCKIDTSDISKMNAEQLKTMNDIIGKLKVE